MDTQELRRIGQRADRVGADRQLRDVARESSDRQRLRAALIGAILAASVVGAIVLFG